MNGTPKFCANCGQKLEYNKEIKYCPNCGTDLDPLKEEQSTTHMHSLPYKSPGTAALIAFLGGLFALPGIGHIYIGKVGMGIVILVCGFILYAFAIVLLLFVYSSMNSVFTSSNFSINDSVNVPILIFVGIPSISYIALFIWQIFNARKLAKEFNEIVRETGREPV